jgi:S1-C subfamily serine protease
MLIRDGKVTRPVLGISTVPDQISRRLLQGELGVIVAEVQQNTGAAKAGLQSARFRPESGRIELGDIVVAIDGNRVETTEDLLSVCEQKDRGDTATLSVKRGGLNGPSIDTRVTLQ